MKKVILSICTAGILSAAQISTGLQMLGGAESISLSKGDLNSTSIIYGVVDGSYKSFQTAKSINSLKSIVVDDGYIVKVDSTFDSSIFSTTSSLTKECEVILEDGLNISSLPILDLTTKPTEINGASVQIIYGIVSGSYKSYNPTKTINSLKATVEGGYYIIKVSGNSDTPCESNTTIEQPPETPSLDDNETEALSTPPSVPTV